MCKKRWDVQWIDDMYDSLEYYIVNRNDNYDVFTIVLSVKDMGGEISVLS